MVKKKYNNRGTIYDLYDETERNQKQAKEKAKELRIDGFYSLLLPRIIGDKAVFFVYFIKK